jgi:hypothetical protein
MMSIIYVFWMYVILFAVIGVLRGWAKELLVSFSVILALALNFLLRQYIPIITSMEIKSVELFWVRTIIVVVLVYFGYQTVALIPHLASKAVRERLQDALFGAVLGAVNGYLIAGTILFYYINDANYPYPYAIGAPPANLLASVQSLMAFMPPRLLGVPGIYFAVILSFIFVIVVYI